MATMLSLQTIKNKIKNEITLIPTDDLKDGKAYDKFSLSNWALWNAILKNTSINAHTYSETPISKTSYEGVLGEAIVGYKDGSTQNFNITLAKYKTDNRLKISIVDTANPDSTLSFDIMQDGTTTKPTIKTLKTAAAISPSPTLDVLNIANEINKNKRNIAKFLETQFGTLYQDFIDAKKAYDDAEKESAKKEADTNAIQSKWQTILNTHKNMISTIETIKTSGVIGLAECEQLVECYKNLMDLTKDENKNTMTEMTTRIADQVSAQTAQQDTLHDKIGKSGNALFEEIDKLAQQLQDAITTDPTNTKKYETAIEILKKYEDNVTQEWQNKEITLDHKLYSSNNQQQSAKELNDFYSDPTNAENQINLITDAINSLYTVTEHELDSMDITTAKNDYQDAGKNYAQKRKQALKANALLLDAITDYDDFKNRINALIDNLNTAKNNLGSDKKLKERRKKVKNARTVVAETVEEFTELKVSKKDRFKDSIVEASDIKKMGTATSDEVTALGNARTSLSEEQSALQDFQAKANEFHTQLSEKEKIINAFQKIMEAKNLVQPGSVPTDTEQSCKQAQKNTDDLIKATTNALNISNNFTVRKTELDTHQSSIDSHMDEDTFKENIAKAINETHEATNKEKRNINTKTTARGVVLGLVSAAVLAGAIWGASWGYNASKNAGESPLPAQRYNGSQSQTSTDNVDELVAIQNDTL